MADKTVKTAYFDCSSGVSGDMFLGALLDAGLSLNAWKDEVDKLGLKGVSITRKKVRRAGISGTKLNIQVKTSQPHRDLHDIETIISRSKIQPAAKDNAVKIFRRLAAAESRAHGVKVSDVHFHEVGAVDSIIDITGSAIAVLMMGIDRIISSPMNLGSGTVKFSHGTFPVPAPATAELIKGFPAYGSDTAAELTTPTGAAIITTLAEAFGPMPLISVAAIGCGTGGKDLPDMPNLLRVFIDEPREEYGRDSVTLIETNIDDMDPRLYEYLMERLFGAGALDVWLTPIIMKKSRPAITLSVLSEKTDAKPVIDIIMRETTTFGLRISETNRVKLGREIREVETGHGKVRVKLGLSRRNIVKAVPEYEDVKALAKKTGKPAREIAIKAVTNLAIKRSRP
ncbi:MAG: nickel pincer cofactor biosynthesis protein LarC [Nitrospirota bacterium]